MRVEVQCKRTIASNEIVIWFHAAVMTKSQVRKSSNTTRKVWLMNFMSLLFVSKLFRLLSRIISFFQEAPKLNIDLSKWKSCKKMTLLKSQVRLVQSIWLGYGLWTAVVAGCCEYSWKENDKCLLRWRNNYALCLVIQVGLTMMISDIVSVSDRVEVGRNAHTWLRCIIFQTVQMYERRCTKVNLHSVQFNTHQEMRSNHNTFSDRRRWTSATLAGVTFFCVPTGVPWGK